MGEYTSPSNETETTPLWHCLCYEHRGEVETNSGYMRVHPSALVSSKIQKKAFSSGAEYLIRFPNIAFRLDIVLLRHKYTDFFDFHKLLQLNLRMVSLATKNHSFCNDGRVILVE